MVSIPCTEIAFIVAGFTATTYPVYQSASLTNCRRCKNCVFVARRNPRGKIAFSWLIDVDLNSPLSMGCIGSLTCHSTADFSIKTISQACHQGYLTIWRLCRHCMHLVRASNWFSYLLFNRYLHKNQIDFLQNNIFEQLTSLQDL